MAIVQVFESEPQETIPQTQPQAEYTDGKVLAAADLSVWTPPTGVPAAFREEWQLVTSQLLAAQKQFADIFKARNDAGLTIVFLHDEMSQTQAKLSSSEKSLAQLRATDAKLASQVQAVSEQMASLQTD